MKFTVFRESINNKFWLMGFVKQEKIRVLTDFDWYCYLKDEMEISCTLFAMHLGLTDH